jgi:hypothetical protein
MPSRHKTIKQDVSLTFTDGARDEAVYLAGPQAFSAFNPSDEFRLFTVGITEIVRGRKAPVFPLPFAATFSAEHDYTSSVVKFVRVR